MIKVLIVEDSPVVRDLLVHILGRDPQITVVGTAGDGEQAVEMAASRRPDVITMDINMPKMNGFEATRRIMETHPVPIVIVSASWDAREVQTTFRAIEVGALAVLARPLGIGHPGHEATAREFVTTVKLMSEVKVVRRWPQRQGKASLPPSPPVAGSRTPGKIEVVAIGASTGGPIALQTILSGLPKDFPAPVLIVQHIAPGFVRGFAEWLTQSSGPAVRIAENGPVSPGVAYVAPDGLHMEVRSRDEIILRDSQPHNGMRPSVSVLFRSVAHVFGANAAGVLLTGMGKDGAAELRLMKDRGAVTLAQDEASSVVYGMPAEAINLDAAAYVLPPERIASTLVSLAAGK